MTIEDIIRGIVREELDRDKSAAPAKATKPASKPKADPPAEAVPSSDDCLVKARELKAKFGVDEAKKVIGKFAESVKDIAEKDRAAFIAAADERLAEDL